ncbi:MAG: hypothetical protein ACTHMU_12245 [Thermomicrobiales bacterium]
MDGLTEGRMVHYVLPDGRGKGEHRPAVVVHVWRQYQEQMPGYSNLLVFTDAENDGFFTSEAVQWRTSVHYNAEGKPGTWHWIERA